MIRRLLKEKMKRDVPPQPQEEGQVDARNHISNYSNQLTSIASVSTAHVQPSASITVVSTPMSSARLRKGTKQKRKKAATTTSSSTITQTQEKKKKKVGKEKREDKQGKKDKQDKQDTEDKQDKDYKEPRK